MQSSSFKGISVTIVIIASIFVLMYYAKQAAETTPFPIQIDSIASSTDNLSEMTSVATSTREILLPVSQKKSNIIPSDVRAPRGVIHAEISRSEVERAEGLSNRAYLAKDSGMLFVFPTPASYGIWMKDMKFPLDIVWIDSEKNVIGVLASVLPETYPTIFYPPTRIAYVLELNSGGAKDYGIAAGTHLVF